MHRETRGAGGALGDARGKIALVERGQIPFREKGANAAQAGAAALVVYNNQPGIVVGTLGGPSPIPVLAIPRDQGRQVLDLLRAGPVTAALNLDAVTGPRTTWNVIGSPPGAQRPGLVIGAHYDSVEGSPGANDNASGVAVMLEVARLLRGQSLPAPVEFVAFGAEELGLFGSEHYVRSDAGRGVAGMVNLDMLAVGERMLIGNSDGGGRLVDAAVAAARALGIEVSGTRMPGSDHVPFEQAGAAAVLVHRPDDPRYHSPDDVPEHVRPDYLDAAVRITLAVARSKIARAAPEPVVAGSPLRQAAPSAVAWRRR